MSEIPDGGMLAGHANGQPVLVARRGDELFAVGASCTHYGGPLAEGLLVGDTVRCPWHHACFSLRTGEAVRAPALNPIARFKVERRGATAVVTGALPEPPRPKRDAKSPAAVVIVGAGAAGDAAADMLRRLGYAGSLTMIGADPDAPYDRPNLSKDYLAGNAPEEWIPLRPADYYTARDIALVLGQRVAAIDRKNRRVTLENGAHHAYDALLLCTGASPIRLPKSVDADGRVRYLRSLGDSRALIAAASSARTAVVIGASFIGLEVAASLRARKLDVHVVAPEPRPLERVMGRALSDFVRGLHETNGVTFHLGHTAATVGKDGVVLDDGSRVAGDLVVAGIGVRPNDELASAAGLTVDKGIVVDERLETSQPGIYAAGDVARYPDRRMASRIRVEHWVLAQRHGQAAARNILGFDAPFREEPFFWSNHYGTAIAYVGHAERWDEEAVDGSVADADCAVRFRAAGRTLAVATVGRDRVSLQAEVAMEREIARAS